MPECAILTVIMPRLRGYWHPMGSRWRPRPRFIITLDAVSVGWINIFSLEAIYPRLNKWHVQRDAKGWSFAIWKSRAGIIPKRAKNGGRPLAKIAQRFFRIMLSAYPACGNFTLLAANIYFIVRMGWYFNCNWTMITMQHHLRGVTPAKSKISIGKNCVQKSILENHRAWPARQRSMGIVMWWLR